MQTKFIRFILSPGDADEIIPSAGSETPAGKAINDNNIPDTEGETEEPLIDKVKEELQAWSNKDQADADFDDTRV